VHEVVRSGAEIAQVPVAHVVYWAGTSCDFAALHAEQLAPAGELRMTTVPASLAAVGVATTGVPRRTA
jgi:hypothetical protein